MCPIVGFAEDSSRADVSATEEVQAGLLDANDSHVDVPDDALSVSSNISLDGTSKESATAQAFAKGDVAVLCFLGMAFPVFLLVRDLVHSLKLRSESQ